MSHTIQRRRIRELHRLNEVNYQLVMRLIPDILNIGEMAVSRTGENDDLYLQIIERSPYTTVLSLTHHFQAGSIRLPVPDLWLRVYHDVCVAEAIAQLDGNSPAHARAYDWHKGLDADVKRKLNTFTERWLRHCLQQGHCFRTDDLYSESLSV
jgi:uncharacterized protein YqiB (DUF1249 family)